MSEIVAAVVQIVLAAIEVAIKTRKSIREALAESLEEAAAKIRAGEIMVDEALDQARRDQSRIDALRKRGRG